MRQGCTNERVHLHHPLAWLYVVIEGVRYEVEPAEADTPTSVLFRAWCAGCGAEYTYPFRVSTTTRRAA